MGKTPLPLHIVVHPTLLALPEVVALGEKGHTISPLCPECAKGDLLIGPTCWRIVPALMKYLDLAIKAARGAARGKKGT